MPRPMRLTHGTGMSASSSLKIYTRTTRCTAQDVSSEYMWAVKGVAGGGTGTLGVLTHPKSSMGTNTK